MEALCRLSYSGDAVDDTSRVRRFSIIALLLALTACHGSAQVLRLRTRHGEVTVLVTVADSPEERQRGLMSVDRLDGNEGMAFLFRRPTRGSFWMKDTLIPLSVAFWNRRHRIVEILDMDPCHSDPCPVYEPGASYVGALEVDQGFFRRNGVEIGDRVEFDQRVGI